MIYQFKIQIKGITKPPVWRRITVPTNLTFRQFHQAIQLALGWEDDHLYEFKESETSDNFCIAELVPDFALFGGNDQDTELSHDAAKTKLTRFFKQAGQTMVYIYDFGDCWVHQITLEAILRETQKEPICLAGKGACPPNDCGGVMGYEEMKNLFKNEPQGEEANSFRDWLLLDENEIWDPEAFDIEATNGDLLAFFKP